ncbi:SusC/RagA family TonB-linked outer membrane protein [Joostella atrarenae]|uniref:SusC/RagA family TonB-linked outer membrane protein n=1 Tax=Joostella atrarenae TaxID=679257 RepID=A0ABS9J2Q8_9FLAO|nr:SusC/RagA family TonB-linked outer membrane protein [Joostella atrarenae]MCF8714694.1 SusC/RagA family TonB-linked outer membrane protein [Joostella atrarenae]
MNLIQMKKIFIIALLFFVSNMFGQQVRGIVSDNSGPLPGANIMVKGTMNVTVTDFDGKYNLNDVPRNAILVFSYLGYKEQEVAVLGNSTINVQLQTDQTTLEEVVVVGYGTRKKSDLTTSVAKVSSENLTTFPVTSVVNSLEGRAAGVRVLSSGAPGEDSNVLIRGINTFGNSKPLIVADGVFVESIDQINPASVESVDILKDAAAAAIYGSRASNGVIIITTKKGEKGKPKINLRLFSGTAFVNKNRFFDVISGEELAQLTLLEDLTAADGEGFPNSHVSNSPSRFFLTDQNGNTTGVLDPDFVPANTNQQSQIYNPAFLTNFDLGISAGGDIGMYNLNVGYYDEGGVQLDTGFKRYSTSLNSQFRISDNVKITQVLNGGVTKYSRPENDGGRTLAEWALLNLPYLPVYDEEGKIYVPNGVQDRVLQINNPLLIETANDNDVERRTLYGSLAAEFKLSKNFTNTTRVGYNIYDESTSAIKRRFGPDDIVNGTQIRRNQEVRRLINRSTNSNASTNFTYRNQFGNHSFDASFIAEIAARNFNQVNSTQISSLTVSGINQISPSEESITSTQDQISKISSQIFRVNYDFKDKYLFTGSIRRDVSSVFPAQNSNNEGYFPAGSVGWVVSKEKFMEGIGFISNLKLKASVGVTANNNIDAFSYQTNLLNNTSVVFGSAVVSTLVPDTFSSDNLTWETSYKTNYGIDISLFENNLSLSAEYFKAVNNDLLLRQPIGFSGGVTVDPYRNIGEVQVDGLEFTLGYSDKKGPFQWNAQGNISFINTQVNQVNGEGGAILGGQSQSFNSAFLNIIQVGKPLYALQGLQTDGIFKSIEELKTAPLQEQRFRDSNGVALIRSTSLDANGERTFTFTRSTDNVVIPIEDVMLDESGTYLGDIRYKDINGNYIASSGDDITIIGDPNPDFTYSLDLKAYYKGFDFNVFFTGVYGNDVLNVSRRGLLAFNATSSLDVSVLDRYRLAPTDPADIALFEQINPALLEANTDTDVPRFDVGENRNAVASDRFIEEGSYLRVKNITLGYSVNKKTLRNIGDSFSKFRIYMSAQNLFTFTKYTGPDPEIKPSWSSRIQAIGVDNGFAPLPTQVLMGVEIEF